MIDRRRLRGWLAACRFWLTLVLVFIKTSWCANAFRLSVGHAALCIRYPITHKNVFPSPVAATEPALAVTPGMFTATKGMKSANY